MPRSPSMRKTAASALLLSLVAVASISALFEGVTAQAAQGIETTNPSPASPSPAPSPSQDSDPSVDHSSHGNHAQHKSAAAAGPPAQVPPDVPCFADPSASDCANFTRPKGSWLPELTRLCDAMDYMPGCTLWRECKVSG